VGSIRSPLWRHGGTTHGPQPRDYSYEIPRKVKKLAMRVALSQKLRASSVLVLDAVSVGEPKTKRVAELLGRLGLEGTKTLIVEESGNTNLRLAARNHPRVKVVAPTALSVYDVLWTDRLVLTRGAAGKLTEIFRP
jgi:large subunit ribosomal protein L4